MVENEIQFLSWDKFERMAPSILQLEVRRIEQLMERRSDDMKLYNDLVRARFELQRFLKTLETVDRDSVEAICAPHLRASIIALSANRDRFSDLEAEVLDYIGSRLKYVHDRMVLLF